MSIDPAAVHRRVDGVGESPPQSEPYSFEEAGHFVISEQGERFAAEVRLWVEQREL
ncbi:MAG: hypothetical protein OXG27_09710 [Chloroflexi bacterium]|nr:hypothetical protein [Chloroflexota bacterium]